MDPFGIDSGQSCSIIPKVSIVFSKENGIIPIGIHSEKFHNTCPEQNLCSYVHIHARR